MYMPWIYGERSPVDDRNARAALFNISLENTREDIIRAFLEGVALNTRWLISPAEKFLGRKLTQLNFVGGGAKSDVWSQILADVLDLDIRPMHAEQRSSRLSVWDTWLSKRSLKGSGSGRPIHRTRRIGHSMISYSPSSYSFIVTIKKVIKPSMAEFLLDFWWRRPTPKDRPSWAVSWLPLVFVLETFQYVYPVEKVLQ